MLRIAVILLFGIILNGCALSDGHRWSPVQASLWEPVQAVPADWDVYGVRINLPYGKNRNVYGADVGIGNVVTDKMIGAQAGFISGCRSFAGWQAGFVCITQQKKEWESNDKPSGDTSIGIQTGTIVLSGAMSGIQLAAFPGLPSYAFAGWMNGIQISGPLGLNSAGILNGIQIGTASEADNMNGVQVSVLGNTAIEVNGLQVASLFNWNTKKSISSICGIQVGLLNCAQRLYGVQFGLINIHKHGLLPFFPIINIGFGGKER